MAEEEKTNVKLVVVGDGAVGKTTLLIRYVQDRVPGQYIPTVFENYYKQVTYKGFNVNFGLWDTAGQEEYDRLRVLSYHETDIILVVFSIDQPTSLENLTAKWVPEVRLNCPGVPILVIGTKKDLRNDKLTVDSLKENGKTPVTLEQAEKKRDEIKAIAYLECSAITGEGVGEIFNRALEEVLRRKGKLASEKKKSKCTIL